MSKSRTLSLLLIAAIVSAALAMPYEGHKRTVRQVSTFAGDRGDLFQDIFQIPIQALQAISDLISNTATRIQKRREAYEAAHQEELQNDKGELRSG